MITSANAIEQEKKLQEQYLEYYRKPTEKGGNSPPNMRFGNASSKISEELLKQREKDREVMNRQTLMQTMPIAEEVTKMFQMLNRPWLKVDAIMSAMFNDEFNLYEPQVRIKVTNSNNGDTIYMEPFELNMVHSIVQEEISQLISAFDVRKQYTVHRDHEPLALCYHQTYHLGAASIFLEQLAYNLETDQNVEEEVNHEICQPGEYDALGHLEVIWTPMSNPDERLHDPSEVLQIMDPNDMIGEQFIYKLQITGLKALKVKAASVYFQYKFYGKTFISDKFENVDSHDPAISYEYIHRVKNVDKDFLDYLAMDTLRIEVYVQAALPIFDFPPISTSNPSVAFNLGNYEMVSPDVHVLAEENNILKKQIKALSKRNNEYAKLLKEAYSFIDHSKRTNSFKSKLKKAIELDRTLRGPDAM